MTKILILTYEFPPFNGGVGTYALNIAKAAQEIGFDVTVVAPNYYEDVSAFDSTLKFKIIRFNGSQYLGWKAIFSTIIHTFKYCMFSKHEIIHAIDLAHSISLSFINHFFKIKFITTVYGTDILGLSTMKKIKILGIPYIFNCPEKIFAISEFTKSLLFEKYNYVDKNKVKTVLLGVDEFWFNIQTGIKEFNNKKKILLSVSRLDPRKGHKTVLKALGALNKELKDKIQYVIVGDGNDVKYKTEIQILAQKIGVDVIFKGVINDIELRELYSKAYIFCLPGEPHPLRVEGFGLVFLEAAAQKLPSILVILVLLRR